MLDLCHLMLHIRGALSPWKCFFFILQHRKLDLDQKKSDLACVIQDKLQLEERLQKSNELVKSLQTVSIYI